MQLFSHFVLDVRVEPEDSHSVACDLNRSPNHHIHRHGSLSSISLVTDQSPSPLFQVGPYPPTPGPGRSRQLGSHVLTPHRARAFAMTSELSDPADHPCRPASAAPPD